MRLNFRRRKQSQETSHPVYWLLYLVWLTVILTGCQGIQAESLRRNEGIHSPAIHYSKDSTTLLLTYKQTSRRSLTNLQDLENLIPEAIIPPSDLINQLSEFEVHNLYSINSPSRHLHSSHSTSSSQKSRSLIYTLNALGVTFDLYLSPLANIISQSSLLHEVAQDGKTVLSKQNLDLEDCHFEARLHGHDDVLGFVSLCNGVFMGTIPSGVNFLGFSIQPISRSSLGLHAVFPLSAIQKDSQRATCNLHNPQSQTQIPTSTQTQDRSLFSTKSNILGKFDQTPEPTTGRRITSSSPPFIVSTTTSSSSSSQNQQSLPPIKYVNLLIVNDHARFLQYGPLTAVHSTLIVALTNSLFAKIGTLVPSAYRIQLQIVGMYTFSLGDPWSFSVAETSLTAANWISSSNSNNPDPGEVSASNDTFSGNGDTLLGEFKHWASSIVAQGKGPALGYDVAHLFTGVRALFTSAGFAYLGGACEPSFGASISMASNILDWSLASITAHELAHTLGVRHTDETPPSGIPCKNGDGTIMDPSVSLWEAKMDWASCTGEWIANTLQRKSAQVQGADASASTCLNSPYNSSGGVVIPSSVCGDGLVQGKEECDCPANNCQGLDPCCDGSTCKLLLGKVCSAKDACCNPLTCDVVRNTQQVCRASRSSCDSEEKCDGINSKCPVDLFKSTGSVCLGWFSKLGICFAQECLSYEGRCVQLGTALGLSWVGSCPSHGPMLGSSSCGSSYYCADKHGQCFRVSQPVTLGSPCGVGMGCNLQGACVSYTNLPLPGSISNCTNGVKDGVETSVDCGGLNCPPCALGGHCRASSDCVAPYLCTASLASLTLGNCVSSAEQSSLPPSITKAPVSGASSVLVKEAFVFRFIFGMILLLVFF